MSVKPAGKISIAEGAVLDVSPVAKLDGAYLLEPESALPSPGSPFGAENRAPAVRSSAETLERARARACHQILTMMMECRWCDPRHPSLNPYRAARLLHEGWSAFRRDVFNDLQLVKEENYGLWSEINPDTTSRLIWDLLRQRVDDWSLQVVGHVMTPRKVIETFEKHWVPPEPRPDPAKTVWKFEEEGAGAGIWDGWESSGMVREGTIHEVIEDVRDPVERQKQHNQADEDIASIRKAQEINRSF